MAAQMNNQPRRRNDESHGLITTLWADLCRKELPHAEDPLEDARFDEHQDARRDWALRVGTAHNISAERRARFMRRSSTNTL